MDFAFSLSIDSGRGILCCWNCAIFAKSSRVCNARFMAIKGFRIIGGGPQGLICNYVPTDHSYRLVFFDSVISFVNNWDCNDSIIFGDVNSVHRDHEQWGVNGFGLASVDLCNFVNTLSLHDLSLQGSSFTFFGCGQNVARSRINRFLISDGSGP